MRSAPVAPVTQDAARRVPGSKRSRIDMSRQDANAAFARTSFLYGGNADYIEELYARYEADPQSVDGQWRTFFESLKDDARDVVQNAEGPSWAQPDWPPLPRGDLVSALDGDWGEVGKAVAEKVQAKAQAKGVELSEGHVQQATRDSVRALMLIRAYRMRGHLHANLDPLGLEPRKDPEELDPAQLRLHRRRSRPADLPRPRARPRVRHPARDAGDPPAHLLPDARRRVHAHLRSRSRRPGSRSASRGRTRRSASPARASGRSSTS